jgi:hypothetical protein
MDFLAVPAAPIGAKVLAAAISGIAKFAHVDFEQAVRTYRHKPPIPQALCCQRLPG